MIILSQFSSEKFFHLIFNKNYSKLFGPQKTFKARPARERIILINLARRL